jgi:hypothetical protein
MQNSKKIREIAKARGMTYDEVRMASWHVAYNFQRDKFADRLGLFGDDAIVELFNKSEVIDRAWRKIRNNFTVQQ